MHRCDDCRRNDLLPRLTRRHNPFVGVRVGEAANPGPAGPWRPVRIRQPKKKKAAVLSRDGASLVVSALVHALVPALFDALAIGSGSARGPRLTGGTNKKKKKKDGQLTGDESPQCKMEPGARPQEACSAAVMGRQVCANTIVAAQIAEAVMPLMDDFEDFDEWDAVSAQIDDELAQWKWFELRAIAMLEGAKLEDFADWDVESAKHDDDMVDDLEDEDAVSATNDDVVSDGSDGDSDGGFRMFAGQDLDQAPIERKSASSNLHPKPLKVVNLVDMRECNVLCSNGTGSSGRFSTPAASSAPSSSRPSSAVSKDVVVGGDSVLAADVGGLQRGEEHPDRYIPR